MPLQRGEFYFLRGVTEEALRRVEVAVRYRLGL